METMKKESAGEMTIKNYKELQVEKDSKRSLFFNIFIFHCLGYAGCTVERKVDSEKFHVAFFDTKVVQFTSVQPLCNIIQEEALFLKVFF